MTEQSLPDQREGGERVRERALKRSAGSDVGLKRSRGRAGVVIGRTELFPSLFRSYRWTPLDGRDRTVWIYFAKNKIFIFLSVIY